MSRSSHANKKLPHPEYFSLSAELEILKLKEMVESLELNLNELIDDKKAEIEKANPKQYDSEHDYHTHMDCLYDEMAQLKDVEDFSKKLAVVGFYMIVENVTKKIMKWLYDDLDEKMIEKKLRSLHRWDVLKKELSLLCGFDLSGVAEYSTIDELRCLNNVIKHSGYVDRDLVAFPKWRDELDKEIDTSLIDLEKFSESILEYIQNLVEKINKS